MPIYVYELVEDGDEAAVRFEFFQRMDDPPLTQHPETGLPIRRIISAPYLATKYSTRSTGKMLSDDNLDRLGFTKYVKKSGGGYEKRAGPGPDDLSAFK